MAKLKNSNCDKTQKNKWWQNLKDPILTQLKNSNCAKLKKLNCGNSKTQIVIVIKMKVVTKVVKSTSFSKKNLNTITTDQLSGQLFAILAMFYTIGHSTIHFFLYPEYRRKLHPSECADSHNGTEVREEEEDHQTRNSPRNASNSTSRVKSQRTWRRKNPKISNTCHIFFLLFLMGGSRQTNIATPCKK